MARPLRVEYPGAFYHVMNRGLGRMKTFQGEEDHGRFTDLLKDVARRWGVKVYAYCLMSHHYHALIQTPRGNLARVMRHVDGLYTQRFNRANGRDGPLFRGRYKALVVDADRYLWAVIRYIHLNPVEVGLVREPGAYEWSSHRLYRRRRRPEWLAWEEILDHFGGLDSFERFVAEGNEAGLQAFYARKRWSPFLGDEGFIKRVSRFRTRSPEHPRRERSPQFPSLEAVAQCVCERYGATPARLRESHRGHWNEARNVGVYLSSRVAGFTHREIRGYYGIRTDAAVTRMGQRVEMRRETDRDFRRRLDALAMAKE